MNDFTVNTGYEDDLYPDAEAATGTTALDDLKRILAADASNAPITLPIPNRPGMGIRYDTNIDAVRAEHWQRRSIDVKTKRMDMVRFGTFVIAATGQCVIIDGKDAQKDGENIRPASVTIRESLGLPDGSTPYAIIRALFGSDGHIISASDRIMSAAGYGSEIETEEEDPTIGS